MSSEKLVGVVNLGIAFERDGIIKQAVENSSFAIQRGKTLAIVGESGSGKSVSSLSLMALLHPTKTVFTSGAFYFHADIVSGSDNELLISPKDPLLKALRGRKIAMIFQEPMTSLNPVMTCGKQVGEVLQKHLGFSREKARARALELFNEVKLPRAEAMLDQYPHQLSGGQRQRVMIALAIACEPILLIADEPTTALDVTVQREILLLLKSIQAKRHMSMIFITHDLGVVEEIADEVLVMKRGKILEQGPVNDILHHPQNPYTRGLLQCRPNADQKAYRLLTVADFESDENPARRLRSDSPPNNGDFLSVKALCKHYASSGLFARKRASVVAVDNVSFTIQRGETLGLVGESGCGKTTLSRMLLGLIPSTSGTIEYHFNNSGSTQLTGVSKQELRALRKEIQIIFQDPYSALNPKHTIGNALTEPMLVHGIGSSPEERKSMAIALLEKVGLGGEHFTRYPHEFSGGQRQRIVIARALACKPSFIICDESVSALDVSVQAQVLNLLNDLKAEFNLTYLFISHDLRVVHYMSDRIMVMRKGRIEEIGVADQVFNHPTSEYSRQLLDAIPGK
jgi:peptide/nickel transport system ATP-binding protein